MSSLLPHSTLNNGQLNNKQPHDLTASQITYYYKDHTKENKIDTARSTRGTHHKDTQNLVWNHDGKTSGHMEG
jgi:hypothetical protein